MQTKTGASGCEIDPPDDSAPVLTLDPMITNNPRLTRRDALRFLGLASAGAFLPSLSAQAETTSLDAHGLPDLRGPQAGYFRFSIGDFDAVSLSDGGFGGPLAGAP